MGCVQGIANAGASVGFCVSTDPKSLVHWAMAARFVVMPQVRFRLHYLLVPISDVAETPFISLGTDVSNLSRSFRKCEYPSTAGETDSGTHRSITRSGPCATDSMCGNRSRTVTVCEKRCLRPGCTGRMT